MPYIVFRAAVCSTGPAGVHESAVRPQLISTACFVWPRARDHCRQHEALYVFTYQACVWRLRFICDDHFDMQGIHKSGFYLGCVMCGRSGTVCASVQLCVLSACVCLHEREREHGGNWNHPTVPRRCQHKLELGCYCGA